MRNTLLSLIVSIFPLLSIGQPLNNNVSNSSSGDNETWSRLSDSISYRVDFQGSFSKGKTPLWLNANKHGLSSLEKSNGYVRAMAERPLQVDFERKWGIGYGVDLVVPVNYTSNFIIQQAYMDVRWLKGNFTVGAKEFPMELKNNQLSSGSQALGINARPVPQVRLSLSDYWVIPYTRGWVQIKGHLAYGAMTDKNWQHDFTNQKSKYVDNQLFHSKAGYLRIGNTERFNPFSVEFGLEMASMFGGDSYLAGADGTMQKVENKKGFDAFWRALIPGGGEVTETIFRNAEGNQLGAWQMRLNWDDELWDAHLYAEKYFEDHSAMLFVDYDGYGEGNDWQKHEKRKYFFYDIKDMMLGFELKYKYDRPITALVLEYLYTKYQSGPIYHDHTPLITDHIGGIDNYYNHYLSTGWQHWGQVMGNPLYMSPIYNTDGTIEVKNNRFMAFHLGLFGMINQNLHYRLLTSYQDGLGTYQTPYYKFKHNVSCLLELDYQIKTKPLRGWGMKAAFGSDMGSLRGHNYGAQITLSKTGILF